MKRSRFLIPLLSLAFIAALVVAGRTEKPTEAEKAADVDSIISEGKENNQVMTHLDHLTNRIGPRLTASDGLQRACEWAVEHFKEIGLENAHLEQWGEFPVGFERGPWFGRMIAPEEETLIFGTNAWTAGTIGRKIGYAVMLPTKRDEFDSIRDDLEGAWVMADRPQGGRGGGRGGRGRGGRGGAGGAGGGDAQDEEEEQDPNDLPYQEALAMAREAGIAGVVNANRNQEDGVDLIVTRGNYRIEWDNLPTIPEVQLMGSQFDSIKQRLENGERVELEFDIRNYFKKGPIPLYNVIADIPGTEFPDEYIIVGGHLDSWDAATGAQDNGTGCSTTFEAARILMAAGIKPRRTIRFMLWTGEEQGLLGSRAYVEQHPEIVEKVSAVLVHDGGTNYVNGINATANMVDTMHEVFEKAKTLDDRMEFVVEEVETMRPSGGSDHVSFIRGGAPGFFWRQSRVTSYRYVHHTQWDTYDSAVPDYQKHTSIVVAIGAYGLAQLDEMLPRDMIDTSRGGGRGRRGGGAGGAGGRGRRGRGGAGGAGGGGAGGAGGGGDGGGGF